MAQCSRRVDSPTGRK
ncbi:hypothetical protein ID866_4632 [Astraeus odoratus]|nr:hypothetical protein ID866_4632 [Astraeus odoratus]